MPKETPKLQKTHPVPQHIAAFEFKLIGDLTLKQFLFAGVGIAVSYAAWISNLSFLTKWATIIFAAGLGLGTAFFPIQDRTLDRWLLSFIAALFSPTQRIWRKEPLAPEYLREDYSQFLTSQVLSLTPLQSRSALKQYLEDTPQKEIVFGEKEEEKFIEKLNFDFPLPPTAPITPKSVPPPKPPQPSPPPKVEGTIKVRPVSKPKPLSERRLPAPLRPTVKNLIKEVKKPQMGIPQLERQNVELKNRLEQAEQQLKSLLTLKEERVKDERYRARLLEQERQVRQLTERQKTAQRKISKITGGEEKEELFSIGKQLPNVVSGLVKNKEGKLLEGVVIIIKDRDADPARALKTDKLGRFAIATPLENGEYTVEISGRGDSFDIIKIVIDGSVLPPLEFKEKND